MSLDDIQKTQYFSNGDFEKVAANIISSPRRVKTVQDTVLDESIYQITPKQQEYYTKCFKSLLKSTQGTNDLNGAICGADQRVVSFFKRSNLDVTSLSKIWTLSDVNEDGWLDLREFSTAMHLVVINVKGEIAIPDVLPEKFRPPRMPARLTPQKLPPLEQSFEESQTVPDGICSHPMVKQFSNTPPLLVDSRPTAIKHSALLSLKSPSGPPPEPPARPSGHGRSASLDLKLIALNNWGKNVTTPPQETYPSMTLPHPKVIVPSRESSFTAVQPPPIPQRISPPEEPKTREKATQTSAKLYTEEEVRAFISNFGKEMETLIGDEVDCGEVDESQKWSRRCSALRKQNAEMEAEKAKLAQVRLQLEIRLEEIEERGQLDSTSL